MELAAKLSSGPRSSRPLARKSTLSFSISPLRLLEAEVGKAVFDGFRRIADIYLALFCVLVDNGGHANQAVLTDLNIVRDSAVDSQETVFTNFAIARNNHMRRDKYIVANYGLVTDVIATPQDNVITYTHRVLQHVVFHDEAILADLYVVPDEGARAYVRRERITFLFRGLVKTSAHTVQLCVRDSDKSTMPRGRVSALDFLEGYNWKTE